MRRAARVDANQSDIVAALEKAGAIVFVIGKPFDLLVYWRNRWTVIECKVASGGFTKAQVRDLALLGPGAVLVARTVEEAVLGVQYAEPRFRFKYPLEYVGDVAPMDFGNLPPIPDV